MPTLPASTQLQTPPLSGSPPSLLFFLLSATQTSPLWTLNSPGDLSQPHYLKDHQNTDTPD